MRTMTGWWVLVVFTVRRYRLRIALWALGLNAGAGLVPARAERGVAEAHDAAGVRVAAARREHRGVERRDVPARCGLRVARLRHRDRFGTVVGATLVTVPAVLAVAALAVALYGTVPRLAAVSWVAVAFMAVVGYLGRVLRFPEWTRRLSPMEHVPQVPAVDLDVVPLLVLGAAAVALAVIGLIGFDRRDIAAH